MKGYGGLGLQCDDNSTHRYTIKLGNRDSILKKTRIPQLAPYQVLNRQAVASPGITILPLPQGVAQGIVCLPMHDAIAVQRQHAEWAKEVMLETWSRHMDGVKTVVKVDVA